MKKIFLFLFSFLFVFTSASAAVVKIGDTEYTKLSTAISKVTAGTKTTITFIDNVSENVTIPEGKDIIFDLNNYTLSNNGNKTVIANNGTLEIKNGTVTSDATNGMINNNSKGKLTLTSGEYIATGLRQVIYNNGGTLNVMPDAYLESATDCRATLHNLGNGTVNIIGGTIVAKESYAIYNEKGTFNIGVKDDIYNKTSLLIQGATYGVLAKNKFNIYDGTIRGVIAPVGITTDGNNPPGVATNKDETQVNEIEEDSEKLTGEITDASVTYQTLTYKLDSTNRIKILFDANGGTSTRSYKWMYIGNEIGELPDASKVDNEFDGWFTEETGGTKVTSSTKPTEGTTYYAHWTYVDPNTVAYVDGVYMSLADAFATGGNIKLMKNVIITTPLSMDKASTLDLNGHTINLGNKYITITDEVSITDSSDNKDGKITSTANFTIIVGDENNQTNASLTHTGGTIEGLGKYGAIYNYETVVIDGGTVYGNATENSYVIYNVNDLTMKSGVVHSANGRAIQVGSNSTFVMDGGLVKSDAENDQTVNLYGDCDVTINGGTIEGLNNNTAGIAMFHNTNLTVNGGTIKGHAMAVAGNGNEQSSNANITINGGTLSATDGVGIYFPQRDSLLTVNGGTISGPTGIEIRASKLVVNDGNIYGTDDNFEVIANLSGTTTKGAAIAISQHSSQQPIEVIINGGNLKAPSPLTEVNPLNNPPEAIDLITINITQGNFESTGSESVETEDDIPVLTFITGGTYTTDPSKYVKEGYDVVKEDDNKYVVTKHNDEEQSNTNNSENNQIDDNNNQNVDNSNNENINNNTDNEITDENISEIKETNESSVTENKTNNEFVIPDNDGLIKENNVEVDNPKTSDDIMHYLLIFQLSSIGLFLSRIFKKKKAH